MSTASRITLSLGHVVARLEQDIRQRGLGAGDRYLTASEAAEMLSISVTTAHRAMQTLAEKRMLVRRRNLGTFVGPHFAMRQSTINHTVYVLVPAIEPDRETIPLDPFIRGIRSQINDADVKISFLPRGDVLGYVQELLHSAFAAGKVAGFVPISCPREVYRHLGDSGMPTVIVGTPYGDQQDIASIDVDNRASGRLLTEYLIGAGHRRMALLTSIESRPGDNCFHDGVSEALTEGELPHNALIMRIVPMATSALEFDLRRLLVMPDPPTALIIRSAEMTPMAAAILERLDLPAARACEIVYQNDQASPQGAPPFTCAAPRASLDDIAARIGKMLERLEGGATLEELHVVIPMVLCRGASS